MARKFLGINPLTGVEYERFSCWSPKNKALALSIYPMATCVKVERRVNAYWAIMLFGREINRSGSGPASAWYEFVRFCLPNQIDPSARLHNPDAPPNAWITQ
jgi:hypothetical protein